MGGARAVSVTLRLYTTTRDEGVPAVASAMVVAPSDASPEPRPVIAWAHGTTGIARACAPSLVAEPLESGAFFAADRVLEQGWVLVATDYVGLGTEGQHPYLVGEAAGRSVLDAVRAAKQLDELGLDDRTVVWGNSQGGGAALWTGRLAPTYAPDVNVIAVAVLAPAADLPNLADNLAVTPSTTAATTARTTSKSSPPTHRSCPSSSPGHTDASTATPPPPAAPADPPCPAQPRPPRQPPWRGFAYSVRRQ